MWKFSSWVCPTADGTGKRERLSWSMYGHSVRTLPASEEDAGSLLKNLLFFVCNFYLFLYNNNWHMPKTSKGVIAR
jgi:hypothetical protein